MKILSNVRVARSANNVEEIDSIYFFFYYKSCTLLHGFFVTNVARWERIWLEHVICLIRFCTLTKYPHSYTQSLYHGFIVQSISHFLDANFSKSNSESGLYYIACILIGYQNIFLLVVIVLRTKYCDSDLTNKKGENTYKRQASICITQVLA